MDNNVYVAKADPSVGERIKKVRKSVALSQKNFAATIGISQGHLCVLEKGDCAPSAALLLAICYRHGVEDDWISTGVGEPFYRAESNAGIPVYREFPENGSTGEVIGHISLPHISPGCLAITQRGDFMAPTVCAGDLVICDPSFSSVANDDLIVLKNNWNGSIIRRYRKAFGKVVLTADNPSYKHFELEDEKLEMMAKVTMILRSVNF